MKIVAEQLDTELGDRKVRADRPGSQMLVSESIAGPDTDAELERLDSSLLHEGYVVEHLPVSALAKMK